MNQDWGRGWGVYDTTCAACGHCFIAVAPVGTKGSECPACGFFDETVIRGGEVAEPGDGVWIPRTGAGDVPPDKIKGV
jgi:hypothetical protein